MKLLTLLTLLLSASCFAFTDGPTANWSGHYAPCNRHSDLLSQEHLSLGVRISTSNPALAQQFRKAMDFWSGVLDMEWHEVSSEDCAMQLVDGTPALFDFCKCLSARSHLPDRPEFQGWIAFNPLMERTEREMFMVAVHEIGHVFGLPHNPSASSVMFYLELDKPASLDAADLEALSLRHQLRAEIADPKRGPRDVRLLLSKQISSH